MNKKLVLTKLVDAANLLVKGFCPTGQGGGRDNSCGSGGSSGGGGGFSKSDLPFKEGDSVRIVSNIHKAKVGDTIAAVTFGGSSLDRGTKVEKISMGKVEKKYKNGDIQVKVKEEKVRVKPNGFLNMSHAQSRYESTQYAHVSGKPEKTKVQVSQFGPPDRAEAWSL